MIDDKVIELHVSIDPDCQIIVKNAKIPTTTSTSTKKVPSTKSPSKHPSKSSLFPIWGYIIIAVGIVVLIVFIAYHLYKTYQPSKRIPPNIDEIKSQPTVSNAKVAIVETPTIQKLKLAKVEPNMNNENESKKSQKKDKKTKTLEPTTNEDVLTVAHQQSATEAIPPSKQPPPNPAACNPEVKRIIPRTIKSAEIDSFDEILKNDKSVMMESESVKF